MIQLLGITPDQLIKRVPYVQGVEVFWFVPKPGVPIKMGGYMPVNGFLRRTIETNIVNLEIGPSRVSQLSGAGFGCMLQLTDVRTPNDFKTNFQVIVDDGFFISVNQPADIDKKVFDRVGADEPGLFQNIGMQPPTPHTSTQLCSFFSTTPNIMKIYFEDAGGGWNALKINPLNPTAKQMLVPSHFSLTCEKNAPFLTFEVDRTSSIFRELRNPDLFSQFCTFDGVSIKNHTDDQNVTPGKRGFARLNSKHSTISLNNIAFQSWKTMTFALRFNTMPVKGNILSMFSGWGTYCHLIAYRNGNDTVRIQIEYKPRSYYVQTIDINYTFSIRRWYYFTVINNQHGLVVRVSLLEHAQNEGQAGDNYQMDLSKGYTDTFYGYNATSQPVAGQPYERCIMTFGTKGYYGYEAIYNDNPAFEFDIAWVHFFDYSMTSNDVKRDANSDWMYTQFPTKLNTY
jgi:hypothetical protein